MYVLGIDGGGTKTAGVIADIYGHVVAYDTVGATNQNGVSQSVIKAELHKLLQLLNRQNPQAFSKITSIFAGMAGVNGPKTKKVITQIIKQYFKRDIKIQVDNDGINALYSGTLGAAGIVQIAGTGSITFGINETGERGRVGGWGYLIDNEGSGFSLGIHAIEAVYKEFDGYGKQTLLTDLILQNFSISSPSELTKFLYEVGNTRGIIAPLSKLVMEAADYGDTVANEIISNAGQRIGESIVCLINRLFPDARAEEKVLPIIIVGGVFNRAELFIPNMSKVMEQNNIQTSIVKPKIVPVGGAIIAAWKQERKYIDEDFTNNFFTTSLVFLE